LAREYTRVNAINAALKIRLFCIKPSAGDQIPRPARKIAARTRDIMPLNVKQEFIISKGFLAVGRNLTIVKLKPTRLRIAKSVIAEIAADP
jgi:hypothetical protein